MDLQCVLLRPAAARRRTDTGSSVEPPKIPFKTDSVRMPVLSPASSPWYSRASFAGVRQPVVEADKETTQLLGQAHEAADGVGDVVRGRR